MLGYLVPYDGENLIKMLRYNVLLRIICVTKNFYVVFLSLRTTAVRGYLDVKYAGIAWSLLASVGVVVTEHESVVSPVRDDCTEVQRTRSTSTAQDVQSVCRVDRSALGPCDGRQDPSFGFAAGQPCVLLKLNKVTSRVPQLNTRHRASAGHSLAFRVRTCN